MTTAEGWHLGIGDPTLAGWITVLGYLATACLAFRTAFLFQKNLPEKKLSRFALFWFCLGLLLLALGINKQLDLQTWFTQTGKQMAQDQGWYQNRRVVQVAFIGMIAVAAVGGFFLIARLLKGAWRRHALALAGTAFLLAFVVVRASSFHHVDQILGWKIGGLKMNWILELGGIGLVALAAIRETRTQRHPATDPRWNRTPASKQPV